LGRQILVSSERERDHRAVIEGRQSRASSISIVSIDSDIMASSSSLSSPTTDTSLALSSSSSSLSSLVPSPVATPTTTATAAESKTVAVKRTQLPRSPSSTTVASPTGETKTSAKQAMPVGPQVIAASTSSIVAPSRPFNAVVSKATSSSRCKLFSEAGTFTFVLPDGATRYRILCVGGGGCGVAGFGGGSGYVKAIELLASAITKPIANIATSAIEIRVGRCGFPGEGSSFGGHLTAPGGRPGGHQKAGDGGSGGGARQCRGGMSGGQGDSEFFGPSGGRGQAGAHSSSLLIVFAYIVTSNIY
jgi:hypothetical protein